MQENYLKLIQEEIEDFKQEITIVQGYTFNQKNHLEQIYRYNNSKFENGDVDDEGDKKYFYNINRNPRKVLVKAIDFDTKDINILTASGGSPLKTWYFEKDLKFWMEKMDFGKTLNRIFSELADYGSCVLKIIKNKPYFVDLRNFIETQSADTLDDANYIIEKHLYTPLQFRKIGKEMGWEDVEKAITEFRKMKNAKYITVYERYGEIEETDNKGVKSYPYKRIFIADVGVDEYNDRERQTIPHKGVVLKDNEIDGHPYREFHLEKIAGRWLGIGVTEVLIDPQIRENEIANLQSKSSYWKAIMLFQSRDQAINKNLKTDVRNGQVLNPDDPITQIDMSDRNLAFFNEETLKWLKNRDELTFAYDVIQGERLPAGTPLGSARLAATMTASYFNQIRENIALDIKSLLKEVIVPNFKKENSGEHIVRLVGENLDTFNKLLAREIVLTDLVNFVSRGKLPSAKQYETMKILAEERIKGGKEKIIKIPKGFYENLDYDIKIVITDENDISDVWPQILQAITVDPMLLQDPIKKKILAKGLEKYGINIFDIDKEQERPMIEKLAGMAPMMKGAGGGVARPIVGANMPTEQTL